jgi:hypothetical protein
MMKGIYLINKERQRQIAQEGYSLNSDHQHQNGQLAMAAICYTMREKDREPIADIWPWDLKHWKPTPDDRIRELTKAGALIAAEIDRLLQVKGEKI